MQQVDGRYVAAVYIVRRMLKDPKDYHKHLQQVLRTPQEQWYSLVHVERKQTFQALFFGKVQWYETHLSPNASLENKHFDKLFEVEHCKGKSLHDFFHLYLQKKLPAQDMKQIDVLRKKLPADPRVIVLTKNHKEFELYDGWHAAIAFAARNKAIPVILGIRP